MKARVSLFKKYYKICPNKHSIYDNKDKYCWYCGVELITTEENPHPELRCPKCKKTVPSKSDTYCTGCGEKLIC